MYRGFYENSGLGVGGRHIRKFFFFFFNLEKIKGTFENLERPPGAMAPASPPWFRPCPQVLTGRYKIYCGDGICSCSRRVNHMARFGFVMSRGDCPQTTH